MFVLKCRYLTVPLVGDYGGLIVKSVAFNIQRFQCDTTVEELFHDDIVLGAFFCRKRLVAVVVICHCGEDFKGYQPDIRGIFVHIAVILHFRWGNTVMFGKFIKFGEI